MKVKIICEQNWHPDLVLNLCELKGWEATLKERVGDPMNTFDIEISNADGFTTEAEGGQLFFYEFINRLIKFGLYVKSLNDFGPYEKVLRYRVRWLETRSKRYFLPDKPNIGFAFSPYNADENKKSYTESAKTLIENDRQEQYGDPKENFNNIAKMWSVILNTEVTAKQVCLCMSSLKVCREAYKSKEDNIIDAIGYLALIEEIEK